MQEPPHMPSLLNQQPDTPSDEVSHPIWTSIADTDI